MKTLREWLFQQHQAAQDDLDEIRRQVVARHAGPAPAKLPAARVESPASPAWLVWRELIWPCRRAWAGLAAVWMLIAILDHASAEHPAAAKSRSVLLSPAMVTLLKEQRQLAADLEEPAAPSGTEPLRARPRPRSELQRGLHETV